MAKLAVNRDFAIISVLLFFSLFFSSCAVAQQSTNNQINVLLGEWVGERTNPRLPTEKITLVITKSPDGELVGTFTSELNGKISQQTVEIKITTDKNGRTVLEFEKEVVGSSPKRNADYKLILMSKTYLEGTSSSISVSTVRLTKN